MRKAGALLIELITNGQWSHQKQESGFCQDTEQAWKWILPHILQEETHLVGTLILTLYGPIQKSQLSQLGLLTQRNCNMMNMCCFLP